MERKEKLWNANYNRVMLTNFTLFFSFYLLTPLLPLYLSETFHATKDMIGVVLSGFTVVALLMRPMSGFLVDTFPRKMVLMISLTIYFLLFGGYIVAGSVMLFAVVRTLHGGPYGACTVANSTMAIDVLPSSRRNEGIGYYGLSNNLGSAIAPTVGIFVYRYTGSFDILFWMAFVTAAIGLISTYYVKVEKTPTKQNEKLPAKQKEQMPAKQSEQPQKVSMPLFSLDRFFLLRGWFLALNICLFGFCWGLLSNYLAIYGKEHLGITSGTGVFFFILSAGLMLSRLQGAKSLREGRLTHNALEGILLSTVGYTLFIASPSMWGYYLSAILIGLGNGHMWPAFQNLIISMSHHNERGTANSTILTSWDLGMGMGILLGGVIAETISYDAAFWTMAGVHIMGLLIYLCLTMRRCVVYNFGGLGN